MIRPERYGQLTQWLLIILGAFYAAQATLEVRPLLVAQSFAAFLPEAVRGSPELFRGLQWFVLCALTLWGLNIFLPLSALLAASSLALLIGISIAGQIYARHQPFVVTVLLLFHALWPLYHHRMFRSAPSLFLIGRAVPYPLWLFHMSGIYLASTYTFSGISKLIDSGLGWANGVSLQLWCLDPHAIEGFARDVCLYDTRLMAVAQGLVLLAESSCLLAYLWPRLRRINGFILIGFHLSVELIFDYQFYGNIFAVLLFFVLAPGRHASPKQLRTGMS